MKKPAILHPSPLGSQKLNRLNAAESLAFSTDISHSH